MKNFGEFYNNQIESAGTIILSRTQRLSQEKLEDVYKRQVLRGDRAPITIGAGTNIQDNCVVHVDYDHPVTVGENVTVGHGAIPVSYTHLDVYKRQP